MLWLTIYLASVIVVTTLVGLMATSNDHIRIESQNDVFLITGVFLVWPAILFMVLPVMLFIDFFQNRLKDRADAIVSKYSISSDKHDRSGMVLISERDLKILMKAVRAELIKLKPEQVEIIREELQHRVVERSLLK